MIAGGSHSARLSVSFTVGYETVRRNIMKKIAITVVIFLTGCASSGVVPMGQDTFMITKQSYSTLHSAGSVKADIYREGVTYCTSLGKEFLPINDHGVDGAFGISVANAEVQFRCLEKGDSELRRPTMVKTPNIRIENTNR